MKQEPKLPIQNRCQAITNAGTRCVNTALKDSDFCGLPKHRKLDKGDA